MVAPRILILVVPCLVACGSREPQASQAEPAPREETSEPRTLSTDPDLVMEELRCSSDEDCIATQFSDCCADRDGTCPCEWHALRRDVLEERQLACAVEECTHGACPACPVSEPPGPARCRDGSCQLRAD